MQYFSYTVVTQAAVLSYNCSVGLINGFLVSYTTRQFVRWPVSYRRMVS